MPDPIHETIRAFADGELVVVTDDEERDLIAAASLCTCEKMAFIIRHTSGIVCAPITTDDARRLRLDPMVAYNESNHTTAFMVSIDYKPDGGSGISADERASCCRALSNPNVGADDFARPGHVFPLIARDGGVLLRSRRTEAAVDLCKLSGLPSVGVISELMNEDGTVMKGAQVARFAAAPKLRYVTIADIIAYRQAREKLIERVATFTTDSQIGPLESHVYRSPFDSVAHVAFVCHGIGDGRNVLTRLHKPNLGYRPAGRRSPTRTVLRAELHVGLAVKCRPGDGRSQTCFIGPRSHGLAPVEQ
jgi:3,4-dihydroxy 2-butanone 4-phosphate synthase / GTP cyclohydrolase II